MKVSVMFAFKSTDMNTVPVDLQVNTVHTQHEQTYKNNMNDYKIETKNYSTKTNVP